MRREINKMQQRESCEKTVEERHTGFEVLEAAPNDKFVSASFSSNYQRSRLKKKVASIIPTSLTRKRKVKIIEASSNSPTASETSSRWEQSILSEEKTENNNVKTITVVSLKDSLKKLHSQSSNKGTMNEKAQSVLSIGMLTSLKLKL